MLVCMCIRAHVYLHRRKIVDQLLADDMHEVLHHNDQLVHCMKHLQVLEGFTGTV